MTAWLLAAGQMLGLGTSAGVRPSLTVAVIGVVSGLGWGVGLNEQFGFLDNWLVMVVLVVLAIFESSFDKIPKVDRLQGRLTMPYRVVMGAVAGASTVPSGWAFVVAGAVLGAIAAWCALYTKQITRPRTVPSDAALTLISLWEDLATFAGTVLTLLFAPIGYCVAGFTGLMYWQHSRRRRAKYRRLRGGA
ncbi:MAG: DUF4126 domain-containing protein [Thermoleophilia bacterium]